MTIKTLALSVFALLSMTNCSFVTSSMGGSTSRTGEAWYVKSKGMPGPMGPLLWEHHVYYCPAPSGSAPAQCKEAKMVDQPAAK